MTSPAINADLSGRVAFVTGATSGIGRATAVAFARAGASVAMADINAAGVRETADLVATEDVRAARWSAT